MSTQERAEAALEGLKFTRSATSDGTTLLEVGASDLHEVVLRLQQRAGFETNTFVTAIDRFPAEPRYEVVYQFLSVTHTDRIRVKTRVSGRDPRVVTITDLFPGTAYSERECYDMFGIVFEGHVGLKRLLMPEDYEHFPLRKDFPHHGIEPDKLYRAWDRRRRERPVNKALEHPGQAY